MGHLGVTTFFVLSGLIMVHQSADLFGTKRGPFVFAYRRLIRIVPMYWIAAILCLITSWWYPRVHIVKQTVLSLLFIPNVIHNVDRLEPLLGQVWTLNYEMAFYLLLAISLFLSRRKGILILLIVPEIAAAIGKTYDFPLNRASSSFLHFYTDQLIVLFARGVLIGAWESVSRSITRFKLPFSPAYFMLLPPVIMLASPSAVARFPPWELLSLYSILLVLGCTLVENGTPGRIFNFLVLLGDASYSTYLFHLFAYPIVMPRAISRLGSHHATPVFIIVSVLVSVVVANLIGLLIHLTVERPITRALRKLTPATKKARQL